MPQYIRPKINGGTIFFTVKLAQPGQRLLIDHIDLLRDAVRQVRAEHPFTIDAWVVLPNHLHAVWCLPAGDRAYGQRWGAIKSRFTRGLRKEGVLSDQAYRAAKMLVGHAGVWQPRFWEHHIRSQEEWHACLRYCWQDPVKHGLAQQPEDWPFSSFHRDRQLVRFAAE